MAVEVRDEIIELPTYVWGPEDPNPPFQRRPGWRIYPYTLLDDLGEEARPVRYRALVIENEYLRVTVLPELGGRIYSAVDKPTGEEIFYRNNVVKPGLIALRGAWASGGVEFNFPRGHSVTTVSPVDARAIEDEDGSATIWVGTIEQIYRMSWAVGIRLLPGTGRIETEIRLANRTPLPHPYYFWANAAVPARDDMRMIYPGTRILTWGGQSSWPVHQGKDLSRYTAFERGNDVFLIDSLERFFGVYYDQRDFGLVHVADPHQCFGKKFFTWGTAQSGQVWERALTDEDGQYCEIQSGRFAHQVAWRLLPPHYCYRWLEWWYPVKRTGGFSWANEDAAVRIASENDKVEVGAAVIRAQRQALVRVAVGARVVHEVRCDISPDNPLRIDVPRVRTWPEGPLTLTLHDSAGQELIRHTEGQEPRTVSLREPTKPDSDDGEASVAALLREAVEAEQRMDPERAESRLREALERDPSCIEASVSLGRLTVDARPQDAVERLSAAAADAPEDAAASYYLGLALRRSRRLAEAEVELWRAAHSPGFAHTARVELGLLAMERGEWERAADVLCQSLNHGGEQVRARCMLAAVRRHQGMTRQAVAEAQAAQRASPLDRLAVAEAYFCYAAQGRPRVALRHLKELLDVVPESADPWIELALDYAGAGLVEEAVKLLEWSSDRVSVVRRSPLVHYLLAYLLGQRGEVDRAERARERAAQPPADLVFAHHRELEAALRDAVSHDGEDARAHEYLGNLLYYLGRREEALAEWEFAANRLDRAPVLYRNLALAYRQVRGDLETAEMWLRKAVGLRSSSLRAHLELDEVLAERNVDPRERLTLLDAAPESIQRRYLVGAQKTAACLAAGMWDRALSLLRSYTFHRWEMEFRMRRVYVEACLGRGAERFDRGDLSEALEDFLAALEYPPNLRIGRPPRPGDARAHWCAGLAYEALGDAGAARRHWEAAASESHHTAGSELAIYRACSLVKTGKEEEGERLLCESVEAAREAAQASPEQAAAQGLLALALKAVEKAQEAEEAAQKSLGLDPWQPRVKRLISSDVIL
jgi:tetratricopeptide (TPR) repeat protein